LGRAADTSAEMSAVEGMQTTAGALSAYGHCLLVFVRERSLCSILSLILYFGHKYVCVSMNT